MGHEILKNGEEEPFDLTLAIENDPVAKWISDQTFELYSKPEGQQYQNMVNFTKWLKVNKPQAMDTLYFDILIGSTPLKQPKAPDLEGEYSIEKFVRDDFPEKDLKNLK